MERRKLLGAMLAAFAAPAIVRAESLMALPPQRLVLWGDGVHDDTKALQALLDGKRVLRPDGSAMPGPVIGAGSYVLSDTIYVPPGVFRITGSSFIGVGMDHKPLMHFNERAGENFLGNALMHSGRQYPHLGNVHSRI